MACTVLLEIRAKKEHVDDVAGGFKDAFPDTRSFDGCIDLYATQNEDDPQNFVIVENWESRAKYEAYFAWRTERGDIDNMKAVLEGDMNIRFFDRIGA